MTTLRNVRPLHVALIVLLALLFVAGGYVIGSDMAHRDAARAAANG